MTFKTKDTRAPAMLHETQNKAPYRLNIPLSETQGLLKYLNVQYSLPYARCNSTHRSKHHIAHTEETAHFTKRHL
jgi:hypothetical protein